MKDMDDAEALIGQMGQAARAAAVELATASAERKHAALIGAAESIRRNVPAILEANARDLQFGRDKGLSDAMIDRLRLDEDRLCGIEDGLRAVAEQRDPVGEVVAEWDRPTGLHIRRVRTPIGVIGVIYESRPNVTADAGALALKSGNAVILRGGSESLHSSQAIHGCMVEGVRQAGLPEAAIQLVPTRDRAAVSAMLRAQGLIDVIIPRGGKGLVGLVQREARVPVFAHLEGICHIYVDRDADAEKARRCGAERKDAPHRHLRCRRMPADRPWRRTCAARGADRRSGAGRVEVRADGELADLPGTVPAQPDDFGREFLDMIIAAKLVDGVDGAIDHIRRHGSQHTESILTERDATANRFSPVWTVRS